MADEAPNPYAPPSADVEAPADEAREGDERVGGWARALATVIDNAAVWFVTRLLAPNLPSTAGLITRASATSFLVCTAAFTVLEISYGATPAMLVLGLRVRNADGSRPSLGRLAAKAFAVRVAMFYSLQRYAAVAFGVYATLPTVVRHSPWQRVEYLLLAALLLGFLLAFGRRRQTHIDRALGLAVYRGRGAA